MNRNLSLFLGRHVSRRQFECTAGEERAYAAALNVWKLFRLRIESERFLSRTLGAKVKRAA